MNVAELREILADLPDDMIVIKSSDDEGNSYSEVHTWGLGEYVEEEYPEGWCPYTYEDENGEEVDEIPDEKINAVCFW